MRVVCTPSPDRRASDHSEVRLETRCACSEGMHTICDCRSCPPEPFEIEWRAIAEHEQLGLAAATDRDHEECIRAFIDQVLKIGDESRKVVSFERAHEDALLHPLADRPQRIRERESTTVVSNVVRHQDLQRRHRIVA